MEAKRFFRIFSSVALVAFCLTACGNQAKATSTPEALINPPPISTPSSTPIPTLPPDLRPYLNCRTIKDGQSAWEVALSFGPAYSFFAVLNKNGSYRAQINTKTWNPRDVSDNAKAARSTTKGMSVCVSKQAVKP
ncbi:hypothetical protein M1328_04855 [Patescibacteria group bacterium]|nr:hypothetical protein [Patescibacteria group bacterium]